MNCYPLENEDEDNGDYQEFVKNKNEKNKNLIILKKENGQLDLYEGDDIEEIYSKIVDNAIVKRG